MNGYIFLSFGIALLYSNADKPTHNRKMTWRATQSFCTANPDRMMMHKRSNLPFSQKIAVIWKEEIKFKLKLGQLNCFDFAKAIRCQFKSHLWINQESLLKLLWYIREKNHVILISQQFVRQKLSIFLGDNFLLRYSFSKLITINITYVSHLAWIDHLSAASSTWPRSSRSLAHKFSSYTQHTYEIDSVSIRQL